jgi:hypothetical protein
MKHRPRYLYTTIVHVTFPCDVKQREIVSLVNNSSFPRIVRFIQMLVCKLRFTDFVPIKS